MDRNEETIKTWNKIAELYEKKFMDMDNYNSTYDEFCSKLTDATSRILDIGTGPGNIPKYLLSVLPDLKIEGIDIAPNMVERAQKNIPNGKFSVLDSRDIHKLVGRYDGIVCGFCIPYLTSQEAEKLITDAFNLLADGGLFYLSYVDGPKTSSGWKSNPKGERVFFNYHQLDKLEQQMSKVQFKKWRTINVPYKTGELTEEIHSIILAEK